MKIGLDIDGVILDSENVFRASAELYDLLELHKNGVVNPKGFRNSERYDWNANETSGFREKFIELTKKSMLMPNAKEVLQLLKKDGHELIIITARGLTIKGMKEAGEERLNDFNLTFNKYFWCVEDKTAICKQESIDIMIDDKSSICNDTAQNKIKTLYFRDVNREKLGENEYLKEVNNWGEIYRYIYNLSMEEKTK